MKKIIYLFLLLPLRGYSMEGNPPQTPAEESPVKPWQKEISPKTGQVWYKNPNFQSVEIKESAITDPNARLLLITARCQEIIEKTPEDPNSVKNLRNALQDLWNCAKQSKDFCKFWEEEKDTLSSLADYQFIVAKTSVKFRLNHANRYNIDQEPDKQHFLRASSMKKALQKFEIRCKNELCKKPEEPVTTLFPSQKAIFSKGGSSPKRDTF